MKAADVGVNTYINSTVKDNLYDPIFKVDNCLVILKCKKILAEGYQQHCAKNFFQLKDLKIMCLENMQLMI